MRRRAWTGCWVIIIAAVLALAVPASYAVSGGETIVFVRHAEKPGQGLGQLTCQGLNRALALPVVLLKKFGMPNYIFAPDPAHQMTDAGVAYSYIRPLATIEPMAIRVGLPVDAQIGAAQIDQLQQELLMPRYAQSLIFVAWEHRLLDRLVKNLVAAGGGNPGIVPTWSESDYDSIFVVYVTRDSGNLAVAFSRDAEGLNGQPTTCSGSQ